jgi:hypothetical protein
MGAGIRDDTSATEGDIRDMKIAETARMYVTPRVAHNQRTGHKSYDIPNPMRPIVRTFCDECDEPPATLEGEDLEFRLGN